MFQTTNQITFHRLCLEESLNSLLIQHEVSMKSSSAGMFESCCVLQRKRTIRTDSVSGSTFGSKISANPQGSVLIPH